MRIAPRTARRLRIAAVALVVAVALPLVVDHVTVRPAAALTKAVFEAGQLVTPGPGFAADRRSVAVQRGLAVAVDRAPTAHLDVYRPRSVAAGLRPIVLWVHGGGFLSGSSAQVADYAITLAAHGYVVASLDYSLAPGTRYPAPVRQGDAALGYLRNHAASWGADPERIVLGGDSAGAQIAGQLAAVETDPALASAMRITPEVPTPGVLRGVVLFCGLYDMRTVGATGFPALRTFLWSYTGYRDWTSDPVIDQLSVTSHLSTGYPPTFVSVGDGDPFRSQAVELAGALHRHGVPVSSLFWDGSGRHLGHEYQFDLPTPSAQLALQRTLGFLARRTNGGGA